MFHLRNQSSYIYEGNLTTRAWKLYPLCICFQVLTKVKCVVCNFYHIMLFGKRITTFWRNVLPPSFPININLSSLTLSTCSDHLILYLII